MWKLEVVHKQVGGRLLHRRVNPIGSFEKIAYFPLSSCTKRRVMTSVDLISKTSTIFKNTLIKIRSNFA